MDHLVLPEGVKPWIKIAYECEEKDYYDKDRGNFFEFPKARKWTDEEIKLRPQKNENLLGGVLENEAKKRSSTDVEAFFQTWLFFGLIIEVFALSDIHVTTQDFLVPFELKTVHKPQMAHLVTTEKLPSLIVEWRQKTSKDSSILEKVMKLLDHVGKIVDDHCANGKDHRSVHQYGKVLWPLKDETTTSIIAVAAMLRKAARQIYNVTGKEERWPVTNSRIIHLRIQRKWCKSDTAMIMEDFDIDGQYYIASTESHGLESLDDHYACTDHSCEAKISDGTYVTKHSNDCEAQDDYKPEPNFIGHVHPTYPKEASSVRDAIKNILDAHHLPVLRWDKEQRGLATYGHARDAYVEEGSKTPPYVAISHVWADGMGNPFDNSLPCCQFDRIQGLVDDLCANHLPKKSTHESPGFWMDTICCIVGLDKDSKEYKSKSITSMREIYNDCVAVLVIDPWLTSIPSTAPVSEIAHRIYTSGWSRRLWTHQEGFLGKDVYYQFQDKPLNFSEVNELAKDYERKMASKGYPITFPSIASSKTSFYYTGIKNIIENIREGRFSKDDRWIIYRHLAESLGHRSTTNIDDELLCVASVIGLNVGDYLQYKDEDNNRERIAERRMQAFLEELGRFHQGIIFNNYRRLTTPGFRWAPVSLLGHRASGLGDIDGSKDSRIEDYSSLPMNDKHIELESLKVKINLTKYMTKSLGLNARFVSIVLDDKTVKLPTIGLPVDYPGYTIRFQKGSGLTIDMAERRFMLKYSTLPGPVSAFTPPPLPKAPSFGKVPTIKGFRGFGKGVEQVAEEVEKAPVVADIAETITYRYVVYVAENDVKWEYDRAYAIILQKPLGDNKNQEFLAMIGLNSIGPGPRTFVQSLCSAVVRAVKPNDSYKLTAGLDVVDVNTPKTNWVVT